jgi:hypothetical protein
MFMMTELRRIFIMTEARTILGPRRDRALPTDGRASSS